MSHIDRSIANMRCEAKRIYNQRMYINKLEKDKKDLQEERDKYKSNAEQLEKIILELYEENKGLLSHLAIDKLKELEEGKENGK